MIIMTTEEIQTLRRNVTDTVNIILLNCTFADKIKSSDKICDLTTFGHDDIKRIKDEIESKFNLTIQQDISNLSVSQLHTMVFIYVRNSKTLTDKFLSDIFQRHKDNVVGIQQPKQHKAQPAQNVNDKPYWNRKLIFAYIIRTISDAYGRPVQARHKLSDLVQEAEAVGKDTIQLTSALKELEDKFKIKIDLGMKLYNIGNAAEESLVAQGKAPDQNITRAEMEPHWAAIFDALNVRYLKDIIKTHFGVDISTYKLSRLKSFDEFKELIAKTQQTKGNSVGAYTNRDITNLVHAKIMFRLNANESEFGHGITLAELGASPLDITNICFDIEKALNVKFSTSDFTQLANPDTTCPESIINLLKNKYLSKYKGA